MAEHKNPKVTNWLRGAAKRMTKHHRRQDRATEAANGLARSSRQVRRAAERAAMKGKRNV